MSQSEPDELSFLVCADQMSALIRDFEWSESPLGSPAGWPRPLKTLLGVMLSANQPMFLAWGPQRTLLYNHAYAAILAAKHPAALGRDLLDVWSEIRSDLEPIVAEAYAGRPVHMEEIELVVNRRGYLEEAHFSFSYTPVRDENGAFSGIFCPLQETTGQVLAERQLAAETDRQRRMFEQAPGFITILRSPDHIFEFVNEAYVRLFGDRSFIGKTAREAFPELDGQGFFELLDQVYRTGDRFIANHVPIRLNGPDLQKEDRFLDFIYEPVRAKGGSVTGIFCEGHDVTEVRRAQDALLANAERGRFLFDLGDRTRTLTDPEAVILLTAQALGECLKATRVVYADIDDVKGLATVRGQWVHGTAPRLPAEIRLIDFGEPLIQRLRAGGTLRVAEVGKDRHTTASLPMLEAIAARAIVSVPLLKDTRFVVNLNVHQDQPREWTDAEVELIEAVAERTWEAMERARGEAALRESEARLRALTDNLPSGMVYQIETSPDGQGRRFLYVSQSHEKLTGIPAEAVLADPTIAYNLILPEYRERMAQAEADAITNTQPFDVEVQFRRPDGQLRWCRIISAPRQQTNGSVIWDGIQIDISDQKEAEAALRGINETLERRVAEALAERNMLASIVQTTDVMVMASDLDYNILAINKANADEFERVYGVRPRAGDNMLALLADRPKDQAQVRAGWARALAGEEVTFVEDYGDPDRARPYYEIKFRALRNAEGELAGAYQFVTDVTERLRSHAQLLEAQEALRQSQKMEAMGQLTGGVAHDFNNLLTPIVGSLDMLQRKAVGNEREQRMIRGALEAAERAKTLVQRLLAFARRQPLQPSAVDLPNLVNGLAGLLGSTLGPSIDVRVETAAELPPAKADANQLEMALLNLAVNARDAMPEGGTLTIKAVHEAVDPSTRSALKPGQYVRLSVSDTGFGMDEDTKARAVEPFFSTKGIGKGTGLGLSMVHGLAAQLGGGLVLDSMTGQGTTVELWLPVSPESLETDATVPVAASPGRKRGKVMLVDDEELVRMSTADMLVDLGFDVLEAGSAEEALRLFRGGAEADLLLTDHLMPGMSGAELAKEMRRLRPRLPVLIVSGYAEVDGIAPDTPRLAKPFRSADLASSLSRFFFNDIEIAQISPEA